jgi:predicted unusual protein kinase regulating ubiquinone biosynthesis (AarF/ABC1/UbiB family)
MITSAFQRFIKLGGLAGRVGASMLGSQMAYLARSDASKQAHRTENLIRNATRIVETLGELKGAAMKVGQMLSLHEGLLPPEVAAVLRSLQREAPRVPFEVMEYEIRGQLKDFDQLFESLEPEAFAAASIGQVHRGRLRDGRPVAAKIQYPLIEEIIKADLKNLKTVLQALFSLFSEVDFDPVWRELRDTLFEELDYANEAENMRRMAELHASVPEILIPGVIEEASTRRVLTMEYLAGIPPERACSEEFDQALKNRWGIALFEFQLRGLFEQRVLHADPNLANFSFLKDGRVIVYDFGCVTRVPDALAAGYAALTRAGLEGRKADIPRILLEMGVFKEGGAALSGELTGPYFDLFAEIVREKPPYTYGENEQLYPTLVDLGMATVPEARDLHFPEGIIFVQRSLSGHFGNLTRLKATAPWRDVVSRYVRAGSPDSPGSQTPEED